MKSFSLRLQWIVGESLRAVRACKDACGSAPLARFFPVQMTPPTAWRTLFKDTRKSTAVIVPRRVINRGSDPPLLLTHGGAHLELLSLPQQAFF